MLKLNTIIININQIIIYLKVKKLQNNFYKLIKFSTSFFIHHKTDLKI